MEYFNSLSNQNWQNIICKWEETPSTMNEMMSIHGVPTICHEEDENGIIFSLAFSDKAIAILDKTIVKPLLDLNLENWLDVIDKEEIRIQFYREITTGYVGYYVYYKSSENTILHEKDYVFSITRETHYNIHFVTIEGVGNSICKDGRICDIICANSHFVISKGALYQLIYSDTEILVNAENEYSQDGCTAEKLVDILNLEKFSLIRYFDKVTLPTISADKELRLSNQSFIITPQVSTIGPYAFFKNMSIEKIVVPYGVEEICDSAFAFCGRLREIELPETIEIIHSKAFAYSAITTYVIPDGMSNKFKSLIPNYSNRLIEKSKNIPLEFPNSHASTPKVPFLHEVYNNGKIGFITESGEIQISTMFDSLLGSLCNKESKVIGRVDRKWFVIDYEGRMTSLEIEGSPQRLLDNKLLILRKGWDLHALYDIETMKYIFEYGQYDYMWDYSSRWKVIRVKKGNKWGVLRIDGTIILPIEFQKVSMREDFCTYVDEKGERKKLYFINYERCEPDYGNFTEDNYERDSWYAMTDGMYGDYTNTDPDYDPIGM